MSINRTKFRIIFQTFRMEPNGGHLKRLAPRWSARPLKHDDEILCNLRLFFYVFLVSDLALNIFSGSGKRGKWCRQELLFGMGWVFQYVFCNSYETKHATTRTCWLRNLQICWVWSQTLRFWPESLPETPSWWCSFLSTLPMQDQRKVGTFLKSNMWWWADVEELRYVLPESLAFPSWCGRWQWEGGCFQFIVDVKLRVSGLSILDSLIWDGSHWSVTLSCVSIDDFVLVMPLQHFLRTSACTASYSERACNSSLSQAIKHLSTRPCHVKKSQWTVSDWLLQFMLHDVGDFPACFFPSELPMLPGITALLAALRGIGWALVTAMSWVMRVEGARSWFQKVGLKISRPTGAWLLVLQWYPRKRIKTLDEFEVNQRAWFLVANRPSLYQDFSEQAILELWLREFAFEDRKSRMQLPKVWISKGCVHHT